MRVLHPKKYPKHFAILSCLVDRYKIICLQLHSSVCPSLLCTVYRKKSFLSKEIGTKTLQSRLYISPPYKVGISALIQTESLLCIHESMSLLSVSPLWRPKTQISGSASSRNPYSSHQLWLWLDLMREENKQVRCIRHLPNALTNPCFSKQGATLANFMLCYQTIFVPIKCCH